MSIKLPVKYEVYKLDGKKQTEKIKIPILKLLLLQGNIYIYITLHVNYIHKYPYNVIFNKTRPVRNGQASSIIIFLQAYFLYQHFLQRNLYSWALFSR